MKKSWENILGKSNSLKNLEIRKFMVYMGIYKLFSMFVLLNTIRQNSD